MSSWNVFSKSLPRDTPDMAASRVVFVREAFNWWALFFPVIVLLTYRLWFEAAAYMVVAFIIGYVNEYHGISDAIAFVVMSGFNILVALELPAMRARKLARKGYEDEGAVVADDREEAERRFFDGWAVRHRADAPPRPPVRPVKVAPVPGSVVPPLGIIGSFPEGRAR